MINEVLWISSFSPYKKVSTAGNKTFSFYFNEIANDPNFSVSLISCDWVNRKGTESLVNDSLNKKEIIFYRSNVFRHFLDFNSKFNPFSRYCGMLEKTVYTSVIKALKKWKKEGYYPNCIILEWTNMVLLAKVVKSIFPNSNIIASEHDVSFIGFERKAHYFKGLKSIYWQIKFKRLKKLELESLKICNYVLPQNKDNIKILSESGISEEKTHWLVPYYCDLSYIKRGNIKNDVLFYGAMGRKENYLSALWFIDNVLPLLNNSFKFIVLGSNPPKQIKDKECDNVVVTGFVDDITPYFERSLCLVAPLVLGAGIKVKILEAASSGIPVLTNKIGIEGIKLKPGEDFFFCEEPNDYARYICSIVNSKLVTNENALRIIKKEYSLEKSVHNYKEILKGEMVV